MVEKKSKWVTETWQKLAVLSQEPSAVKVEFCLAIFLSVYSGERLLVKIQEISNSKSLNKQLNKSPYIPEIYRAS